MSWLVLVSLFSVACVTSAAAEAVATAFKTEPHFLPHVLNITYLTKDRERLAPGYIFHTPLVWHWGWGPQIYDMEGKLVFNGNHTTILPRRAQDFKVCDYLGEKANHLCWHDKLRVREGLTERKVVYDQSYKQVGHNYSETRLPESRPDGHEFNMLPGGRSFLQAVYERKQVNLKQYKGVEDGMIMDGCFEEIDVVSGNLTFSWCASDHYPLSETYVYFRTAGRQNFTAPIAGAGIKGSPWDYLHINAIDKNEEGDYLVSARHWDQILKIAGPNNRHGLKPGSEIWRLNGRSNQFKMIGNLNFSRQHNVRYLSTGRSETVLSLFDNGWEGVAKQRMASCSTGKIIRVNNETMEAELLHEYLDPSGRFSPAQGSMQRLPNGNAFVGWGARPNVSEFAEDGTLLLHGTFHHGDWTAKEWGYRQYKYPWMGKPHWPPKLLTYSRTCSLGTISPLVAYVSWNGATEVRSWKFHVSISSRGPWFGAGTFTKDGFETRALLQPGRLANLSPFLSHVSVTALDKSGNVLGSATTKTFVPRPRFRKVCDQDGCLQPKTKSFDYDDRFSIAETCEVSSASSYLLLVIVVIMLELCAFVYIRISSWTMARYIELGDAVGSESRQYAILHNVD